MKVENSKVVGIEYTLKDSSGKTVDANVGADLLYFIQGLGNIVPGLEKAMTGKSQGDRFEVTVKAAEGYGEYDDEKNRRLSRKKEKGLAGIKEGMTLQSKGPDGVEILTVTSVSEEEIVADGNHPLAGQNLHFSIHVAEIRDATQEELKHGHAHGADGHHH